MTEAYKVGITIALTNKISSGLMMIRGDLAKTDAQALALHATLSKIKKLGMIGAAVGGVGFLGLDLLSKTLGPAKEYAHQLNIMNMAGMKQKEIAESIKTAWQTSKDVLTTTPTENLRGILDLRNITGKLEEAKQLLPIVTKIQTVMAASSEGNISKNSKDIAFSMGKALDIIGAVGNADELQKQAGMMSKVITATQNRVTPQMFQGVFQYARQGKFDMSDEFKYEILPSLMLEAATGKGGGGGSKGVGPMVAAMYRITNQGYVNKKAFAEWKNLGLMAAGSELKTTTSGTTAGPVKNSQLAAANSFQWVNEVLVPAIRGKYGQGISDQFIRQEINALMRGNQLAASLAVEFFTKQQNYLRDQKLIRGSMGYQQAFDTAMKNDPETAEAAADAQWKALKVAVGTSLVPIIIPAMLKLAETLNSLGQVIKAHPIRTEWIVGGIAGLSLALMGGGAALGLAGALKGIQLIIGANEGAGLIGSLGMFAKSLGGVGLALGKAGAVGVAAYYAGDVSQMAYSKGYEIGTWLKDKWNGTGQSMTPPPASGQPIVVQHTSNLDGRAIYQSTTSYLVNDGGKATTSSSNYWDSRSMPQLAGGL